MSDLVDKAVGWDAIAEKNREIHRLRKLLLDMANHMEPAVQYKFLTETWHDIGRAFIKKARKAGEVGTL